MDESLESWFAREILAHEASLVRYLRRLWPNAEEIHDLRQEVYIRVYEAASRARPHSPKSFLFTTARHLLADRIRRERVVSIEARGDLEALDVLIDEVSPEKHVTARDEMSRLARVFERLPPRCREVLWLRRVEELPQKEVAERLRIAEGMVEKHLAKAMQRFAEAMFGNRGRAGRRRRLKGRTEGKAGVVRLSETSEEFGESDGEQQRD